MPNPVLSVHAAQALWDATMAYVDACEEAVVSANPESAEAEGPAVKQAENELVARFVEATGYVPTWVEAEARWAMARQMGKRQTRG